jgi:hypothetical protein
MYVGGSGESGKGAAHFLHGFNRIFLVAMFRQKYTWRKTSFARKSITCRIQKSSGNSGRTSPTRPLAPPPERPVFFNYELGYERVVAGLSMKTIYTKPMNRPAVTIATQSRMEIVPMTFAMAGGDGRSSQAVSLR